MCPNTRNQGPKRTKLDLAPYFGVKMALSLNESTWSVLLGSKAVKDTVWGTPTTLKTFRGERTVLGRKKD